MFCGRDNILIPVSLVIFSVVFFIVVVPIVQLSLRTQVELKVQFEIWWKTFSFGTY